MTSQCLLFCSGVRNAAQRKLFDELGIVADELPVDQFIPLGRMLYKAPSDGKWGEHECTYLIAFYRYMLDSQFSCYLCLLHSACFKGLLQLQALEPFLFLLFQWITSCSWFVT